MGAPSSFAHAASAYESLKKSHKGLAAAGLGTLRLHGWGLPQDHALALSLFTDAAGLAHARGETGLGIMHSRGLAVELDYVIAFRMLHMGAAQVCATLHL